VDQISRIGMDTSKHVFQLHGVNAADVPVLRKKLRRKEMVTFFQKLAPRVIAIEACGASHHLARLLQSFGHTVKLIAPQLVKPYVKRGKNDAADAEALCEAMSRPTMRFVPVKTAEQQAALMLVGVRDRLIRNRTQLSRLRELDQRISLRFAIAIDSQRCGMSGKSPISASEDQRSGLGFLAGSRDRGEADRARAILLTLSGWTSPRIAEAFGVREDTVRLWRSDFSRDGVEALKASIAPGPVPVKSETALRVVTPLLEQPVANRPNWTIARMRAEIAAREGVCISRSQLSKALRKKSSVTGGRGTA
jgi:transposase